MRSSSGNSSNVDVDAEEPALLFPALERRPSKKRRVSRDGSPSGDQEPSDDTRQEPAVTRGDDLLSRDAESGQETAQEPANDANDTKNTPISNERIPSDSGRMPRRSTRFSALADQPISQPEDEVTHQINEGLDHAPGPPDDDSNAAAGGEKGAGQSAGPSTRRTTPRSSPALPPTLPGDEAPSLQKLALDLASDSPSDIQASTPKAALRGPFDALQQSSITVASSPLSSPPPILFDPYQNLSSTPSSSSRQSSQDLPSSSSSRAQSEDPTPASTPLLTSQSSFTSASGRPSLPNLKGRDLFDSQIWSDPTATSVFYTFITTLRQKSRDVSPTSSHNFLGTLRDSRKLVRCYTQNIDQLEERVGLTTSLTLGAGTRNRFNNRNARQSGAARASIKESDLAGQSQAETANQPEDEGEPKAVASGVAETQPSTITATEVETGGDGPDYRAGPEPSDQSTQVTSPPSSLPASQPPVPNRGVECVCLHGSLAELRCFLCGRTSSWDEEEREIDTMAGEQPLCPHCAGATAAREERGKRALGVGRLRPDIVLYGEEHPHAHLISPIVQHDLSLNPDMLLILGTSMRVHGLKVLVREFAKAVHNKGGKVVFINFTKPPDSVWSDIIDYWVESDCDAWVGDLQKRKPILFLPPGTVLEEEPPKPSKLRRSSTSQSKTKRKKSGDNFKQRDSLGTIQVKTQSETGATEDQVRVMALDPAGQPINGSAEASDGVVTASPTGPRPPKAVPRLRRSQGVRDDKANGAWLVYNIMSQLKRITGGETPRSADNSPAAKPKSKGKRPRKSAPAVLSTEEGQLVDPAPSTTLLPGRKPSKRKSLQALSAIPVAAGESQLGQPVLGVFRVSVPGAKQAKPRAKRAPKTGGEGKVPKGRKSKLAQELSMEPTADKVKPEATEEDDSIKTTVKGRKRKRTTWKMVNGVEMRVAVSDGEAEASNATPPVPAKRRKADKQATFAENPSPILPQPRAMRQPAVSDAVRAAWNRTPDTVRRYLPPLDATRTSPQSGPKISQLEPPVASPVDRMKLSARIGVPHPSTRIPDPFLNPFAIQQPLINHMGYPYSWMARPGRSDDHQPSATVQINEDPPRRHDHEEAAAVLSMLAGRC